MYYILLTSGISFLGAAFILLRRVHENRIIGIPGDHKYDAYWPLNLIWNYIFGIAKKIIVSAGEIVAPYLTGWLALITSKMYRVSSYISNELLHVSNVVHGKGSLKKNTGTTSLFIRDISEYKKGTGGK